LSSERSNDPRSAIAAQRRRIALTGVEAAVSALIGVCEDPKAPAPAKATAGTSLLRAAGLFDRVQDAHQDKEASEMTAEELSRAIADLQLRRPGAEDEADEGADIFG
jgi:hypothetical protein